MFRPLGGEPEASIELELEFAEPEEDEIELFAPLPPLTSIELDGLTVIDDAGYFDVLEFGRQRAGFPQGRRRLALVLCLDRDDFSSNSSSRSSFWWNMIFSENRYPLFGIMLCSGRDRGRRGWPRSIA